MPNQLLAELIGHNKAQQRTRFQEKGSTSKMATPAKASDISKTELMEAYSRLKTKVKKSNDMAKREGEAMMRDFMTIGAGAGLAAYMAYMAKGKSGQAAIDAQQVGGLDLDMLIGGGALAAGMFKWAGKMSDSLRAIGVGGLTAWASRVAYHKVETSP
jgi:hypothetical protein